MDTNKAYRQIEDPRVFELMEEGYSEEEAIIALRLSAEIHPTDSAPSSNLLVDDDQQNNHNKQSNGAQKQDTDPRVLELIEGGMDEDEAIMALRMSIENNVANNACNLVTSDFTEEQELQLAIQMSQQEEKKDDNNGIISLLSNMNITNDIANAGHLFHCDIHSNIKCEKVTECPQMEVICAVLAAYHKFITQQEEEKYDKENSHPHEMRLEFYAEGREKIDLINDFNHLLKYHASEFEDIYNLFIDRIYDGKPCDLKTCKLLKRNQRDRSKECNDLYHTAENEEIVLEQLLDRIHCHFFHTFDIGYKITKKNMENIMKEAQNMTNNQIRQQSELDACDCKEIQQVDDESDEITNNAIMTGICKAVKEKSKNYEGVDGLERLYSTQNRFRMYDFQNDTRRRKWDKGSDVEIFCKSKEKWMKGVIIDIKMIETNEWLVVKYDRFKIKEIQRFSEYIRPLRSEGGHECRFGYGYRFFYWPYYKDNMDTFDDARGLSNTGDTIKHDANTGYTVGQLYVEEKYDGLKQELLKNKISTINLLNWNQELEKARTHLRSDHCKQMKCVRTNSAQNYRLGFGWRITENHLTAIVVYCGYDKLQRKFSETFRGKSNKDTIQDIIKMHSEFHHLARLLRECVECFGMDANVFDHNTKKVAVYHGASKEFMFESLFAYVKGPFSTTTEISVAQNFAGANGIVVTLNIHSASWTFKIDEGPEAMQKITCFQCEWVSDFSNEQEIFNIGGLNRFHFVSIIEKQTARDYTKWIKGITQLTTGMTHGGIAGDTLDFDIPKTQEEKQIAYRLGAHLFFKHLPDHEHAHEFTTIPEYIDKFMDLHCKSIKAIHVRESRPEFEENIAFNWFFRNKDNDWIKLDDIMANFPGVEHIQYYAHNKDKSFLDDVVLPNLLGLFNKTEKKYYPRFSISVDPSREFENEYLPEIVDKYQKKFENVGWRMGFYATNPLEAWIDKNKSFKVFTDAIQSNTPIGLFYRIQAMKFLEKFNVDKILSIWCKGAQKEGFELLDDWEDTKTLVFYITPSSPRS